jgi:hypothetical protein
MTRPPPPGPPSIRPSEVFAPQPYSSNVVLDNGVLVLETANGCDQAARIERREQDAAPQE